MSDMATKRPQAGWTTVAFGDVVRQVKDKVDPEASGLERYVAGEHMDTDDLRIRRWGEIGDGYLGPAFHMRFKPGQVLYGSRRTYLRKVAVADFEGITANTTYVLESANPDVLLPELLPFIMQTEAFNQHSVRESKGSVNPYVNFSDLAWFEFTLPPIEEQRRALRVLTATTSLDVALWTARDMASRLLTAMHHELAEQSAVWETVTIADLCSPDAPLCYGVVQPGDHDPTGVPLLRVCDIEASTIQPSELKRITPQLDTSYRRSRVTAGDVLVSVVGTIGRVFVVGASEVGFNIARAIARIRTDKCEPVYLAMYLRSPQAQRELNGESFETARKTLNLEALGKIEIPVPPRATQAQWCRQLGDAQSAIAAMSERRHAVQRVLRSILEPSVSEGGS